nr:hypothetical protein [Spirosoma profusum]
MFVMDMDDNRVRKVNTNGIISTVAGNGSSGASTENVLAVNTTFNHAKGIAVDAIGRIYIADTGNNRIRRIETNGTIITVAGNGNQGYSGDGVLATNASLAQPTDIALDNAGNLYIVDYSTHRIRKVGVDGIITTVAGNGGSGYNGDVISATSAYLYFPNAITIDNAGNLYIADSYNNRVRKVDVNGIITTVAGTGGLYSGDDGGIAIYTPILQAMDVAVDGAGNLYIAQSDARVRKVDSNGIITTIAGNGTNGFNGDIGPSISLLIGTNSGVDVDASGNVYISDKENGRIRRITSNGIMTTVAGGFSGDGGLATNAFFRKRFVVNRPANVTVDTKGNVYVVDQFNDRIRKITLDGIITSIAGNGGKGYTGDGGPAIAAQLQHPRDIAIDSVGNLYFADQYNRRLRRIDLNGIITTTAGSGATDFIGPEAYISTSGYYGATTMALTKDGTAFVTSNNCILKITTSGIITRVAGTTDLTGESTGDGGPALNARLASPTSVSLDKDGNLYIAEAYRVRKVDTNGIITTVAGNGTFNYGGEYILATNSALVFPFKVDFAADGTMYISESYHNRIRRVDRNGIISTVAETGTLVAPAGFTFDVAGNLYIAEPGNRRIKKVTYPIRPTLAINRTANCSPTSLTITAQPSGEGFSYQFSPGATQIGTSNQAVVTTSGVYSVTVATSIFGSPAGSISLPVLTEHMFTVKAGNWNDPTVWSCGSVPNSTRNVQLLHVVNLPASYQAEAQRIKYETGSKLNIAPGAKLQLSTAP